MARILVVDDEPLICEMLDITLSRAGHDVSTANDGAAAVKIAAQDPIDLVIADIVMPLKDGLETIVFLRQEHPDLKIIAISGGSPIGGADLLAMARHAGAHDAFRKPLDNDLLLRTISECLETGTAAAT